MKPPRGLNPDEEAVWATLAASVTPIQGRRPPSPRAPVSRVPASVPATSPVKKVKGRVPPPRPAAPVPAPATPRFAPTQGLDGNWERRLKRAALDPDFTLDLHGHTLDQAHRRLDMGLSQAKAMGARLVLVITGKSRPVDAADRGQRRGAIRAKVLDWLAAGPHSADIAAIRNAHRRHGGEGALYLVLRRKR